MSNSSSSFLTVDKLCFSKNHICISMPRRVRFGQRDYLRLSSGLFSAFLCCSRENMSIITLKYCTKQVGPGAAVASGKQLHAAKAKQVYMETTKSKEKEPEGTCSTSLLIRLNISLMNQPDFKCVVYIRISVSVPVISPELSPDNIPLVRVPKTTISSGNALEFHRHGSTGEANVGIALAFISQHKPLTFTFHNESRQRLRGLIACVAKKACLRALSGKQWRAGWTEKGSHCCKGTQSVVAP